MPIKVVFHDWEEVYSVKPVTMTLWTEDMEQFKTNTTYYQTSGGGPEGGYFVKTTADNYVEGVWEVSRSWFQPWECKKIDYAAIEYEAADEMNGKCAQIRILTVEYA